MLNNPMLVETIVQKSGIKPPDVVLEIGLGSGNLARKLVEAAKSVVVLVLDPRVVLELSRRFQGTPLLQQTEGGYPRGCPQVRPSLL